MSKYGLGYWQLNNRERQVYEKIELELLRYSTHLEVPTGVDLVKILSIVLYDNPSIIYVTNPKILFTGGIIARRANLMGTISRTKAIAMEKELQKKVENIAWEIDSKARNDREILQGISDYFQKNIRYDYVDADAMKPNHPNAHNAYGALVQNLAVCEGIAKAYSLVLQYFGIRSMVVSGKAGGSFMLRANHAWNIVEFEKEFYHCDITWDICGFEQRKFSSYQYFGLDDSQISLDHTWKLSTTPKCAGSKLSFYMNNRLCAYSEDQITDIIKRQLKNKTDIIRLKIDDKVLIPKNSDSWIQQRMRTGMGTQGFQYNWNERNRCLTIFNVTNKETNYYEEK